jgi:hypothetical protein
LTAIPRAPAFTFRRDRGGRGIFRKMKYGYRETERKTGKDNRPPAAMGKLAA